MSDKEYTSKGIVKYTSRDYESILSDFIDMVPKLTNLWKPEVESDPGYVLGKYLASVGDMLGINLDLLANEVYAPSVSQRKNAEKIFSLIGYDLGWYTAARTEVTFKNASDEPMVVDFGFNGANFATLNAYTDITNQSRVITYNILPGTNSYGATDTRSRRQVITDTKNVFIGTDKVQLQPGESVTRVAIEGELRNFTVSVEDIKKNNYIVKLPSQHIDTTAVWVMAKANTTDTDFLNTQWRQCANVSEFTTPEPRFAVTYDTYSNAQIQISNYLDQLENYANNYLVIYWVDCSGIIGCVGENVLTNFLPAIPGQTLSNDTGELTISNLSNTVELPNTNTITGKSPETAKEAYWSSRNYINTFDSLVTLPDFNRFLNREPGVDCGLVIDCQKALDINMSIYNNPNLTDAQKSKKYITNNDFPTGDANIDWKSVLNLNFDPNNPQRYVFSTNFKTYTAMCFAIHNGFNNSSFGEGTLSKAKIVNRTIFQQYTPPQDFINAVIRDYRPLQAMSVELQFGKLRIFNFSVSGIVIPTKPISKSVGNVLISKIKQALAMYFDPANREIGVMPNYTEILELIEENVDNRIRHFDFGTPNTQNYGIVWAKNQDIEYFNAISFARYVDTVNSIIIDPSYLID